MVRSSLICFIALLWGVSTNLYAAQFQVLDSDNNPVKDAVIFFEDYKNTAGSMELTAAEMSQTDRKFSPHILVVPQNTPVTFPNYDNISHHVYSFSDAKVFEKKLYKGVAEAPVIFDKTGIVELGCNVHDWMLAYVYVTDIAHFGITDDAGKVTIDLPKMGSHKVKLWHPRMEDSDQVSREVNVVAQNNVIRLTNTISVEDDFDLDEFGDY